MAPWHEPFAFCLAPMHVHSCAMRDYRFLVAKTLAGAQNKDCFEILDVLAVVERRIDPLQQAWAGKWGDPFQQAWVGRLGDPFQWAWAGRWGNPFQQVWAGKRDDPYQQAWAGRWSNPIQQT